MKISARPMLHDGSERNHTRRVMFNMEAGGDEGGRGHSDPLNTAAEHQRRCFMASLLQLQTL